MRNVQVIDGAENCSYSLFQLTDDEFLILFPDDRDVEFVEDLIDRIGEERAGSILSGVWQRPVLKSAACGIHGTLFFELTSKRVFYPTKKESEMVVPL
jgi:hypothetical protein